MTLRNQYNYINKLLVLFLLFLLSAGALNYLIDPYALFDSVRLSGFSDLKPAAGGHVRMAKPYQVRNYSPKGIVAGNSRPEMGIDPRHICWPDFARPVYNLGLPGAGVHMQARTLQHALFEGDVKLILWGLDFADFLSASPERAGKYPWPVSPRQYENRLIIRANGSGNPVYPFIKLEDYLTVIFSLDTAADSLKTITQQSNRNVSTRLRNGFNPANDYWPIMSTEGQFVLFEQKNREIDERFSKSGLTVFPYPARQSEEFASVAHLLKYANSNRVKVILFINSYHADYLSTIYRHNLWPQFEAWKYRLLEIADENQVELWDFSGLDEFNSEPAPAIGDKSARLKWFWEPAHYKKEVGDKMLEKIFGQWCRSDASPQIGLKLSSENIYRYLENEKQKIEAHIVEGHNTIVGATPHVSRQALQATD
ncbi:hypothetical protein [Sedimenticola hydrogenitrophicus]|uniref:hypothetical protein n=1 Tax=Sedimenticola hydrogenitrophicus TaxID=2967975 RepID=UPI0021A8382E|nr:hypothetical protein [Sedimenticola hydrogenitrophicus]